MAIEHSSITDPEIHEPKGVAAATAGQVYVADGAGSGTWTTPTASVVVLSLDIEDASAGAGGPLYIVSPVAGTLSKVYCIIDGAFTVSNITIDVKINGVAVVPGTLTVLFSGSAAGDQYSVTPASGNTLVAGDEISFTCAGGTGPVRAHISALVTL